MKKLAFLFIGFATLLLISGCIGKAMANENLSADEAFKLMREQYQEREKPAFNALSKSDPHHAEYQAALCESYKNESIFKGAYRANCKRGSS